MSVKRIQCTKEAGDLIRLLKGQHGALVFHQSGGCCDGSAPMLLLKKEFYLNETDVLLGYLESVPFYISADQLNYWKYSRLIIDLSEGRGSSFSLEAPSGNRFITKSKLLTEEELEAIFNENRTP